MQPIIQTLPTWGKAQAKRLYRHYFALLAVALACALGQIATLTQVPFANLTPDSPSYLLLAMNVAQGHFFDPTRTPGYPVFLWMVMKLFGPHSTITSVNYVSQDYSSVVIAQAILMIAAIFESYFLTYRLTLHRWAGALVGVALGLNVYLLDWEREILTETLSLWIIVTVFVLFERALRTDHAAWTIGALTLAGIAILVRPFFIYVPALLVVVLLYRALRRHTFRMAWKPLLIGSVLAYGIMLSAMVGNAVTYNYFGLSDIGTVNLLGKIMEYHLQNGVADSQDMAISGDLTTYQQSGQRQDPWFFMEAYKQYKVHYFTPIAHFNDDVVFHNIFSFTAHGVPDVVATLGEVPRDYAPTTYHAALAVGLLKFAPRELLVYWLLPVLTMAAVVWAIRSSGDWRALMTAALALAVTLDTAFTGMLSYRTVLPNGNVSDEFYRMRVPFDWAMLLLAVVLITYGVEYIYPRLKPILLPTGVMLTEEERQKEAALVAPRSHRAIAGKRH